MTTVTATCEAHASGRAATDWGFESLPCNTSRGLRLLTDVNGVQRRYCGAPGHRENVARRFGVQANEAIRVARAIERISADFDEEFDREGQPEFNGSFR